MSPSGLRCSFSDCGPHMLVIHVTDQMMTEQLGAPPPAWELMVVASQSKGCAR